VSEAEPAAFRPSCAPLAWPLSRHGGRIAADPPGDDQPAARDEFYHRTRHRLQQGQCPPVHPERARLAPVPPGRPVAVTAGERGIRGRISSLWKGAVA
jgi:hypothetical protein